MPGTSTRVDTRAVLPSGATTVAAVPRNPNRLAAAPAARERMRWSRVRPTNRKNSSVTAASKYTCSLPRIV